MKRLLFLLAFSSCAYSWGQMNTEANMLEQQINGLSLVSMNRLIEPDEAEPITAMKANWVSVIPFAFMPSKSSSGLVFDSKWQWAGERVVGATASIRLMHEKGVKVMLKPQIWVGHGVFTGEIRMDNEKEWLKFEKEYEEFIMTFAKLAEQEKVEMLCLGTEMNHFTVDRADFWKQLIKDVREVYSGQLTYAENWDAYEKVTFWDQLDFIGIDAYFPVANGDDPGLDELMTGWRDLEKKIAAFSDTWKKKILFTEYGYRSISDCAATPWDYKSSSKNSEQAQWNALEALYQTIWDKAYLAGGFLWKWYPDHSSAGGSKNNMFTVQNKKAEELVRTVYSRK